MWQLKLLLVAAFAGVLAACGGGSADLAGPPPPPPAVAPSIVTQPQDVSASGGQSATFTVSAGGDAPLGYQWFRGANPIAGATSASFRLSPITAGDDGSSFSVSVTNTAGRVASRGAVLHVLPVPGIVHVLAGLPGGTGYTDGPVGVSRFNGGGIATTADGTIYVADTENATIRKIDPLGVMSTLAGLVGQPGEVDGVGAAARFTAPTHIAVDATDTVYVADAPSLSAPPSVIRKVAPDGTVSTLAGWFGQNGFVNGTGANARFGSVTSLATDGDGNVYASDGATVRKITPAGVVSTLAGDPGLIGNADGPGIAARFGGSGLALAADPAGLLYVVDSSNRSLRRISPAGVVSTLLIDDRFASGTRPCVDSAGDLIVAEFTGDPALTSIGQVTAAGIVPLLVPASGSPYYNSPACGPSNTLLLLVSRSTIYRSTLDGQLGVAGGAPASSGAADGSGAAARFAQPTSVAVDAFGNAYVGDGGNHAIRKVTPAGVVSTLVASSDLFAPFGLVPGLALAPDGTLYGVDKRLAGDRILKVSPAGLISSFASAGFVNHNSAREFSGVAVTPSGEVLAAATDGLMSVSPAGVLTPLMTGIPVSSVAVDAGGNAYVSGGNAVGRVDAQGHYTQIAGASTPGYQDGRGADARFDFRQGALAVDGAGYLYLVDDRNLVVRRIAPDGSVSTVAGSAHQAQVIEGSPGGLHAPAGIAIVPSAVGTRLLVVDTAENVVLSITLP